MLDYARTRGTFFSNPYSLTRSYPCFLLSSGAPDSYPPALAIVFVPAPLDSRRHPFLADGRLLCLPVSFVGFLCFQPLALECNARPSVAVWRKCRLTMQDCGILMRGRYTLRTPPLSPRSNSRFLLSLGIPGCYPPVREVLSVVDAPSFRLLAPFSRCHGQASGASISRGRASIFSLTPVTAFPIPLHWHHLRGARFSASTPPASLPPDSGVALMWRAEDGDEGRSCTRYNGFVFTRFPWFCLSWSHYAFPFCSSPCTSRADADAQAHRRCRRLHVYSYPVKPLQSQFARVYSSGMGGPGAGWTRR
jgi:hypothetical protein